MLFHRAWRQIQPCCDLLVGQPANDKAQHVRLSGGDSRCHPGIGLRLLEQLAAVLGQAGQVPAIKSGLGLGQPAKRVAPSVGERSGGGAEPRQIAPALAVREAGVAGRRQFVGPLPLPGSPGQNRLGVADNAPVHPEGADAQPAGLLDRPFRPAIAKCGQQQRPQRPQPRRFGMREAGQDRHSPGVGFHGRRGIATEQNHCSPAGPAEAVEHPVVRIGRDGLGGVPLGLLRVGAHAGAAGQYRQRLGPDLVQTEPLGAGDGGLGVLITGVQFPAAGVARGELELQDGHGTERTHLLGGVPRLGQPCHSGVIKQVDGAQLVQGAQPPERQVCGLRGDQRAVERGAGGGQITQPVAPADELERVTADVRSTIFGGEDLLGEKPGLIEVIGGEGNLGVEDAHAGAHASRWAGSGQAPGGGEMVTCHLPPGGGHRGLAEAKVDLRPEVRRLGPEPGDELAAGRRGLLDPPGQGQGFHQEKFRLVALGSAFEEVSGPPQGADRGGQRPPGQRLAAGLA